MFLYDLVTRERIGATEAYPSEESMRTLTDMYKSIHKQILKHTLVKSRAVITSAYNATGPLSDISEYDMARVFGYTFRIKDIPEVLNLVPFGIVLGHCKRAITYHNRYNTILNDVQHATSYAPHWYCVYMPDVFFNRVQKYIIDAANQLNGYNQVNLINKPIAVTAAAFGHDLPSCTLQDLNLAVGTRGVVKPIRLSRNRRTPSMTIRSYVYGTDRFDPSIKRLPGKWAASLPY